MASQRVVFVGGGTGGHFYPLIAIAERLIEMREGKGQDPPKLYFMGPNRYDDAALDATRMSFLYCPAGKRRRYRSLLNLVDPFKTLWGVLIALWVLFFVYPDVIMSKGGYTSVPVVLAAWLLRIPIVVHESDAIAGSANKLAARFAHSIAVSYPDSAGMFPEEKTYFTGIPVRRTLLEPVREDATRMIGVDSSRQTLLILGGSQGAERVNDLVIEALDELLPRFNIIHQTGARSFNNIKATITRLVDDQALLEHYHPAPFLEATILNQAMYISSLIISRAGSNSIYEIALHAKPAILIPIPGEISHDQRTNAYAYARTGAATVLEEDNLRDGLLEAEIARIMGDQQLYAGMSEAARSFAKRDAAEKLATMLLQIANTH